MLMFLQTPRLDFIVLGEPRSGTTWLANWLTNDFAFCLHDPFGHGFPESWQFDSRRRGISCTGAGLMHRWLSNYKCPIAVIERDSSECDASLARLGLPSGEPYREAIADAPGRRFRFHDLWSEDCAREIWAYLLPDLPFDALRYRMLRDMQVQPMGHQGYDVTTMRQLVAAGLFAGRL